MVDYSDLRTKIIDIENDRALAKFYRGAIFKDSPWFLTKKSIPLEVERASVPKVSSVDSERVSEEDDLSKVEVLDSLKDVVEQKGEVQSKFGMILPDKKKHAAVANKVFALSSSKNDLKAELSKIYSDVDVAELSKIKLLVVGEAQLPDFNSENSHWKTAHNSGELLGKMLIAMKLEEGDFLRSSLVGKDEQQQLDNILKEIVVFNPDVVVTLGAISTNLLYGKKEKLSKVHGECFERSVKLKEESQVFKFVPVFHPELLEINPSMKRTAWIDLQKIMEMIGKK